MNKLVDKKMRVFIKYDKERIKEIIDKLAKLNANRPKINFLFEKDKDAIISINEHKDIVIYTSSMPEYPFIKEYYKEIVLPFKPKDKQPVWGWDGDEEFTTNVGSLVFYDAENESTFSRDGERDGDNFDYYTPYRGTIESWMNVFMEKIKDKQHENKNYSNL